jgi:BASS family bile acid:Na+ symporter
MLSQIILILGFPIVLGMLVSHYFPNFAKKLTKPTSVLSILLFVAMVIVSLSQVLSGFEQRWDVYAGILVCLLVVVIHNAMALSTGYFIGKTARVPVRDRRSLTIETGIQNSGLGLALLLNPAIFPPEQWKENGGMIIVTALWGVWHIVSGLSVATIFRRSPLKD